jgi:Mce-associated membrane protein
MSTGDLPDPDRVVIDGHVDDSAVEYVVADDAGDVGIPDDVLDVGAPDDVLDVDAPAEEQMPVPAASGRTWRPAVVLPLALLLVSALAAGSVYWFLYRADRLTDAASQQQVIAAAREGTEAVLSYSSENLDKSLSDAKSHLTGEFLDHYSKFTEDVVRPAVTQKGVKTEANVARAAVSEMHPGQAQVLVFVNQVTTSKDRPSPALATSTVMVTMVKSGGRWLISEFTPI